MRGREQWATLVDEHEASGQSIAAFCDRRGLERRTLQWWRWKLGGGRRSKRKARAVRLLPVDVVESAGTADASQRGQIVIELVGMTVRIATGTPPGYVAQLVAALRAGC